MTLLRNHLLRVKQPSTGVLGEVLSSDEAKREVELAFVNRYIRFMNKSTRRAIRLACAAGVRQDELEVSISADLALRSSAEFAKIARELERQLPEDLDFGRFSGKK